MFLVGVNPMAKPMVSCIATTIAGSSSLLVVVDRCFVEEKYYLFNVEMLFTIIEILVGFIPNNKCTYSLKINVCPPLQRIP
jgi:hypothetical protein